MTPVATSQTWQQWARAEGLDWLFIFRTVLGMLLALGVAFRLDLTSPGSAAVTVSIIALPQAGMVLEKSFYRLLATVLGASVTLFLLSVLVQHEYLFIAAIALWIGVCTAASSWFRGFRAYAWLLCGLTTSILGFPAFMDAAHAFDIAVDRVTIVSVGILCAGVVNAVVLPARSSAVLDRLVRRSVWDFAALLDATTNLDGESRSSQQQHRFSTDLAELEAARASSVFEDPVTRIRSRRILALVGHIMSGGSRLQLLHRQLMHFHSSGEAALEDVLQPRIDQLRRAVPSIAGAPLTPDEATGYASALDDLIEQWRTPGTQQMPANVASVDAWAAWASTRLLLEEAVAAASTVFATFGAIDSLDTRDIGPIYWRARAPSDPLLALLAGARATLMVVVVCMFWIASEWPEGLYAVHFTAVSCGLLAYFANPIRAAWQMCIGAAIGFPALILCYAFVLPAAQDYPMLCLGLTPFLVFGAWLMTRPGRLLQGSSYYLILLMGMNLTAVMHYDVTGVINTGLACMAGFLLAMASLAVLSPANPEWRPRRLTGRLLSTLSVARLGRLSDLPARFEYEVRDLTAQLIALRPAARLSTQDEALADVLLEVGNAVVRLRKYSLPSDSANIAELDACLDEASRAIQAVDHDALLRLDRRLATLYRALKRAISDGGVYRADSTEVQQITAIHILRLALQTFDKAMRPSLGVVHAA